jgi:hypothetical protein
MKKEQYWKNVEHYRKLARKWRKRQLDKYRSLWGTGSKNSFENNLLGKKAEEFVATEILPKKGFTNILMVSKLFHSFPVDIIARKNSEIYAFLVTTKFEDDINKNLKPLIDYFNWKLYICFVKPDFSSYLLKEVDLKRSKIRISLKDIRMSAQTSC